MSDIAIKIENLSKQYRLGNVGTGTLTHDLKSWWATARGKEDPNLQIGMENKLAEKGGDYVYALKDINLEIKKGDIVGVIGKNGAGKSTLLKILSRVTTPTTGSIDLYGRVASLLEVGTGFHPELTGRENIFLNGAIMGMSKDEIKTRFEEIVDFSGVGKYIDTPVKRYSSGMYVRLAFAVAAHLDPEILIVDEVLAVGDVDFQKKAIGKMQDVSNKDGRTVIYVSHNMAAVKDLCNKGVLLKSGVVDFDGKIETAINNYLTKSSNGNGAEWQRTNEIDEIGFEKITIFNKNGVVSEVIGSEEDFTISLDIKSKVNNSNTIIAIQINDVYGNAVLTTSNTDHANSVERIEKGTFNYTVDISKNILMPGNYSFTIACFESGKKLFDIVEYELNIMIEDLGIRLYNRDSKGYVRPIYKWSKK
jgi:lipopolysaccharide transport system ATP-binding protein